MSSDGGSDSDDPFAGNSSNASSIDSDLESSIPDLDSIPDDVSVSSTDQQDHQYYYRCPRSIDNPEFGYSIVGPVEIDVILQLMLDNDLDLATTEIRQRRFCEWQKIDDPDNFPDSYIVEAERRHTENTSLREVFLKFDLDGSATIDREEMTLLVLRVQN